MKRMLFPVAVRAMWEFESTDWTTEIGFNHETFRLPNNRYAYMILLAVFDYRSARYVLDFQHFSNGGGFIPEPGVQLLLLNCPFRNRMDTAVASVEKSILEPDTAIASVERSIPESDTAVTGGGRPILEPEVTVSLVKYTFRSRMW